MRLFCPAIILTLLAASCGVKGPRESASTEALPRSEADVLYSYEQNRDSIPFFADVTLCPGGGAVNTNPWFTVPGTWDTARFAPHVSYSDAYGQHWLFEAFLGVPLTGKDAEGKAFGLNADGSLSAGRESWEKFAEFWTGKDGAFLQLDKAIAEAAEAIGTTPARRYAVMMLPDAIMLERFSDKSSSTVYWGEADGRTLDFMYVNDRITALEWYIDLVRYNFEKLGCKYLELGGFYIMSEDLVAKPTGWNYQYKLWDKILPKVSSYLASCHEGLYWIPYLGADGTDMWKDLGITAAWLQPGYYWNPESKPISKSVGEMAANGMGIELEFEYSMVESVMKTPGITGPGDSGGAVYTLSDVPALRERFRAYMDTFKDAGLYGQRAIALYSGSNALWQLATSEEKDDIALYQELCSFITGNPLRR